MRRFTIAIALIVGTALVPTTTGAEVNQHDGLRVSFDASIAPRTLPRDRPAPITVRLVGSIATVDGSRPPALQELSIAVNRAGKLSTRGLPTCAASALQQTTTEAALAACREALVGHGIFGASVDFPDAPKIPARGKVLVFNAHVKGHRGMLLHLYGSSPVRAAFVLPFEISQVRGGKFGTVFSTRIPTLASGLGYITELQLTIGRRYSFEGKRRSLLSANCAAPSGFTVGFFELARATFSFSDGKQVVGGPSRICKVR